MESRRSEKLAKHVLFGLILYIIFSFKTTKERANNNPKSSPHFVAESQATRVLESTARSVHILKIIEIFI